MAQVTIGIHGFIRRGWTLLGGWRVAGDSPNRRGMTARFLQQRVAVLEDMQRRSGRCGARGTQASRHEGVFTMCICCQADIGHSSVVVYLSGSCRGVTSSGSVAEGGWVAGGSDGGLRG